MSGLKIAVSNMPENMLFSGVSVVVDQTAIQKRKILGMMA